MSSASPESALPATGPAAHNFHDANFPVDEEGRVYHLGVRKGEGKENVDIFDYINFFQSPTASFLWEVNPVPPSLLRFWTRLRRHSFDARIEDLLCTLVQRAGYVCRPRSAVCLTCAQIPITIIATGMV